MDGRPCTDLHNHSHADPDCRLVHLIFFCVCLGAVRQQMEASPRQFRNSWLLHLGRSANHVAHDAKNEENNMATYSPAVLCAVRTCDGSHSDKWQ